MRGIGSVVPYIRLRRRDYDDGMPGVVDQAFGRQVPITTGNDQKNDQNPVGNGRNGRNDQSPFSRVKEEDSEQKAATDQELDALLRLSVVLAVPVVMAVSWADPKASYSFWGRCTLTPMIRRGRVLM